jgi:hypothetical protein
MIWNLARNAGITIAFGLTLLGTDAAKARSVPLNPYSSVIVPPTSLAVEPVLATKQYQKLRRPFTIMNAAGAVECAGVLQEVVVLVLSNRYDFYYRISTTKGYGAISQIGYYNVGGLDINVAYRNDLPLGHLSQTRADLDGWGLVSFTFYQPLPCANRSTPYLLMKTSSPLPQHGSTTITTTTGNSGFVLTLGP